jgi:hypothetical protein
MIVTLGEVRRVNVGFVGVTTFIFIGGVPTLEIWLGVATLGICVGVVILEFWISTTGSSSMMFGTWPGVVENICDSSDGRCAIKWLVCKGC